MDERTNGGWNVWCMEKLLENEKKKGNRKGGSSIDLFTDCMTERLTD